MKLFIIITLIAGALALVAADNVQKSKADDSESDLESISLRTAWIAAIDRKSNAEFDIAFMNQDGETGVLRDLVDRPTLITFFYTRCQNNYKCSAALTRFTALQKMIHRLDFDDKV